MRNPTAMRGQGHYTRGGGRYVAPVCHVVSIRNDQKRLHVQQREGVESSWPSTVVGSCLGALLVVMSHGCLAPGSAVATGLERLDTAPVVTVDTSTSAQSNALRAAEDEFQNSEFLKTLKERSELHREERQRQLRDTYCRRQAELGVGDCAGLRLIPGATKSGVQKTPEWITTLKLKLGGGDGGSS